ncbi:MAG: hypothetical protein ACJ74H_10645 [Thermoanaerobaculia bacterium]
MRFLLLLFFFAVACESNPEHDRHIAAANVLTRQYTQSRFSSWKVQAQAAGADCDVLFVRTSNVLDDSTVEAIHYGATAYDVIPGGVQRFYRDHAFRGVAYQDVSERVWTYGMLTLAEGELLERCR